jgi:hypothetical protein
MADRQPNIVVFCRNNFGWGELGCYGGPASTGTRPVSNRPNARREHWAAAPVLPPGTELSGYPRDYLGSSPCTFRSTYGQPSRPSITRGVELR